MKLTYIILSFVVAVFGFLAFSASPALAEGNENGIPEFGACPTPGGQLIAGYSEGWHWIPGYNELQWGSDYVYHIGNNNYIQCYCPLPDRTPHLETGIQSNWIDTDNVSQETESTLISQGWMLIEDGSSFGLPAGAYLVKNIPFNCEECPNPCPAGGCNVTVKQNNVAYVKTIVNNKAVSGGNSVSGNTGGDVTVVTGDATATTQVWQEVNKNVAQIPACTSCPGSGIEARIEGNGAYSVNRIDINSRLDSIRSEISALRAR